VGQFSDTVVTVIVTIAIKASTSRKQEPRLNQCSQRHPAYVVSKYGSKEPSELLYSSGRRSRKNLLHRVFFTFPAKDSGAQEFGHLV
jgi:hypothetical protein